METVSSGLSTGLCEDLDQLEEYMLAMHKATISSGQARVLVDETGLPLISVVCVE
jgi:hypothetical protein